MGEGCGPQLVETGRDLGGFIARDVRQVWARHRVTGQPVYIALGTAASVREIARAEWACLVPGCDVAISTRGGSKRDHFFHVASVEHPGGPESAHHLAAKAMLAQWAASKTGEHASVVEEQTIKNPGLDLHRRPDVLVTWKDGHRVAIEVEYKQFPAEAWRAKQDDLDSDQVGCTWLIGHTRVTVDAADPTRVRVPGLGRTLTEAGRHILIVNPITRQIGTLASASDPSMPLGQWAYRGHLHIDDLDDCALDPQAGLVTPAMRRIDEAAAARELEKRKAEAAESALARMRSNGRRGRWYEYERRWEKSKERERILARWGEVPAILKTAGECADSIHALSVHWHAILYEAHVHGQAWEHPFTIGDCYDTLTKASIGWSGSSTDRYRAVTSFLDTLEKVRLVEASGRYAWRKYRDLNWLLRQASDASQAERPSEQEVVAPLQPEPISDRYTRPSPWCYSCAHAMPADKAEWDPHMGHLVR